MMMRMLVVMVAIVVAGAPPARAEEGKGPGFVELAAGVMVPVGGSDIGSSGDGNAVEYDDAVEESFKLAIRGGSLSGSVGPEVALDWTPINDDLDVESALADSEFDAHRFRLQVGARLGARVGAGTFVFGRFLAGADVVSAEATGQVVGVAFEVGETDIGLAAELGAGVSVDAGGFRFGAQLALPMAFHFDDDDPNDDSDLDLDYTGIDLDLLVTVGSAF